MQEPGLDKHEWISRFEAIEPELHDGPAETLAELDDLVAEMMTTRRIPLEERDGEAPAEPETIRQFAEARRVTRQIETGDPYDPGDVANAVDAYRSLYEQLLASGPTADTTG